MMQICKTLPGIKTAEWARAEFIDVYSPAALIDGARVYAFGDFAEIPVTGLGGCVVSTEIVSGQTIYTVKINFNLTDQKDKTRSLLYELSSYPFALRITDIYGEKYLAGTNHKPHPTIQYTYSNEPAPAGKRLFEVEITYVNIFSLLQL
jgi:hypothetical protein